MSAGSKSEKATPRRRQKAREQGQVARSRELSSALAVLAVLGVMAWKVEQAPLLWSQFLRRMLDVAIHSELRLSTPVAAWTGYAVLLWVAPVMGTGLAAALVVSFAQGGFVFAPSALVPKAERLSPARRLQQLFSLHGLSALLKSLLPVAGIAWVAVTMLRRDWNVIRGSIEAPPTALGSWLAMAALELAAKCSVVLLVWAAVDYWLERQRLEHSLRMSRQEIQEELKETEGNPLIRARIRRLQHAVRRRRMLESVPRAAVVVTNPTHFAVALEYDPEKASAPLVVAKGQNLLAEEIKRVARWHGIPLMENPPLAQALYRAVEVGQEIPAKLYTVVAEILALVWRAQARARQSMERQNLEQQNMERSVL